VIRKSILTALATWAIALGLGQNRAIAQPASFEIVGHGVGPYGLPLPGEGSRPHWSIGTSTRFGSYTGIGTVETDTASFLPNGDITGQFGSAGPYIFTAANGDKLACYYGRTDFGASKPGTFTLVPVPALGEGVYVSFFLAEFVPFLPKCTGQFSGVSGSWTMYAMSDPFVLGLDDPLSYEWVGYGSLTFR